MAIGSIAIYSAERSGLRVESDIFLAPRNDGTRIKARRRPRAFRHRRALSREFSQAGTLWSRNDLLIDGLLERDRTGGDRFGGYTSRLADLTGVIRHRFSDTFSMQAGLQVQKGQTSDVLGPIDYFVVGTPVSLTYNSTDKPLDPSRGMRITASVVPYPTFLGSTVGMTVTQGVRVGLLFAR